jgi:hypothetical protein
LNVVLEYSSSFSIAQLIAPNTPPLVNVIDYLKIDIDYIVVKSQDIVEENNAIRNKGR